MCFPMFFPYFPHIFQGMWLETWKWVPVSKRPVPSATTACSRWFRGAVGTVLGPALEEPLQRIVVRWDGARPVEREAQADDVRLMMLGF